MGSFISDNTMPKIIKHSELIEKIRETVDHLNSIKGKGSVDRVCVSFPIYASRCAMVRKIPTSHGFAKLDTRLFRIQPIGDKLRIMAFGLVRTIEMA